MDVIIKEDQAPREVPPDVRARAAALREDLARQTDESARDMGWGRRVTIGDVAKFHVRRDKCPCRGNVEMTMFRIVEGQRVPSLHICALAMEDIGNACGWRTINTPDGPRWLAGVSPEEFGLWIIFQADRRAWNQDQRMRAKLDASCISGGNGRWLL
jgi:hypothetical protein